MAKPFSKLVCVALVALGIVAATVFGEHQQVRAQTVDETRFIHLQAAYLYNIAKLVRWPHLEAEEHFKLCLAGQGHDALFRALQTGVEKRHIQNKPIRVSQTNDLQGCHLVYITGDLGQASTDLLDHLQDRRSLRIAAPDAKDNPYSLVSLVLEGGRIALYINGKELSRSELMINPALLSIARPR